jgi:PemK-like protein.
MCDFRGLVVPEIVKIRPVIIVARNRYNNQLVTVVPQIATEEFECVKHAILHGMGMSYLIV